MIKAYYLCVMILKFINIRSLLGRSSKRRLVNTVLGVAMNRTHVLGLLLHLNVIFETLRAKDTCTQWIKEELAQKKKFRFNH